MAELRCLRAALFQGVVQPRTKLSILDLVLGGPGDGINPATTCRSAIDGVGIADGSIPGKSVSRYERLDLIRWSKGGVPNGIQRFMAGNGWIENRERPSEPRTARFPVSSAFAPICTRGGRRKTQAEREQRAVSSSSSNMRRLRWPCLTATCATSRSAAAGSAISGSPSERDRPLSL